jgi:glycerol-1-phosphate dehydrogenase [NAD(P)+]
MNEQRIRDALSEATDTAEILIGEDVIGEVPRLFEAAFGDQGAVVVADENTLAVAGRAVRSALDAGGRSQLEPYVFDGQPTLHADYENIEALTGSLREHQAIPIAVGSGTINDIVKRAAHECDRPYMNVATAASMDGYTAFGAAITKQGYKQTMTCPAPRAVLADLRILTRAPANMTSAGYADLLAKITAGADWIVADALEVEPIDSRAWSLVQGPLRDATARPAQLSAGDLAAMEGLIEGLVMSGLAMQAASSSRPASGAEHQFSHLWEMEGLGQHPADSSPPLSHGFKVGLGTVSIAALYEVVLERDLAGLDVAAAVDRWPSWKEVERRVRAAHTTAGLDEAAVEETRAKYVDAAALSERLKLLAERWPSLRERLREQLMGADELRAQLRAADCPTTPGEIGLTPERLRDTYRRAQMIRRRFTVLDLLDQTGILEECVQSLFTSGGFWARDPSGAMLPDAG